MSRPDQTDTSCSGVADWVLQGHEFLDSQWKEAIERDGRAEAPSGGGGGFIPAAPPLGSRLDGPRVKGRRPVPAAGLHRRESASGGP